MRVPAPVERFEMSWGESVGSLAPIIICGATPLTKPLTSSLSSKPYTFSQAEKCLWRAQVIRAFSQASKILPNLLNIFSVWL